MWNKIIGNVGKVVAPFNDYLLLKYRKEQVNSAVEYMDSVYKEAIKLFDEDIRYLGYEVLSPEDRIEYKLNNPLLKGEVDILKSELQLCQFNFQFGDQIYAVHIYLPYYFNHSITISGAQYFIQFAIIEKVIYRNKDGIIIKVMRSPLHFWRNEQFHYVAESGKFYYDPIITVKAYYKSIKGKTKKDISTTVILYLLATKGFNNVLKMFDIELDDMTFITGEGDRPNQVEYEYFNCKNFKNKRIHIFAKDLPDVSEDPKKREVFLKVKTKLLDDPIKRKFVASLIYTLSFFDAYDISQIYNEDGTLFKIILGRCISNMNTNDLLAYGHAVGHLRSFSTSLDPYTIKQLEKLNIYCNDVFDLFKEVFLNIDKWLVYHSSSDLFEKKLSVIELLMTNLVRTTFYKFYDLSNGKKSLLEKNVKSLLRMKSKSINDIYKLNGLVKSNPSTYNSNWLLTIGCKKVRQPANQNNSTKNTNILTSKEHLFHYSMVPVESILTIPTSSPGVGGSINPHIEIDTDGCFIKGDYVDQIEPIQQYFTNF